ncbi:MAG TPA: 8-amino-7-oxononanoate synthase [Tepidisphaeraceae bacterium]|nr:8-amino-7-oxononanoate synthase [Tepidisphaeraceae bacterium]
MSRDLWERAARQALSGLHETHSRRDRRQIIPLDSTHVQWRDRRFVNFASNDYLGLTHHPRVIEAAQRAAAAYGAGSGASPLICGYTSAHASAENRISRWKGTEASVLLPSGYQANHAAVQTLATVAHRADHSMRFLLDKLCHASLIDAVRASGEEMRVFPHGNLDKLNRLLAGAAAGQVQVVATETIFSMDGDTADLAAIVELKKEFGFVLLVDEAHSSGAYGPGGSGLAAELGLSREIDISIATLSKAVGCAGGAVCGSRLYCDAMVNFARAYIYSTSLPASMAASAEAAIDVMEMEPRRQQRLRHIARRIRSALAERRLVVPRGDSPIIPVILGSESSALRAADFLAARGMLVPAIRPPTVARDSSRLRVTLSSEHSDDEVDQLISALLELSDQPAAA